MSTLNLALPARLAAGDTLKFIQSAPDHPASDGWALQLTLVNAEARHTAISTPLDGSHLIQVAASVTAQWPPGVYTARIRATRLGEVHTLAASSITIEPGFEAAVDGRSRARRMLEAIEAAVEGRASADVASYTINGRSMSKIPLPELLALRDRLRVDVMREEAVERAKAGLQPRGRISVRFGS